LDKLIIVSWILNSTQAPPNLIVMYYAGVTSKKIVSYNVNMKTSYICFASLLYKRISVTVTNNISNRYVMVLRLLRLITFPLILNWKSLLA
jgi:hypothetical protein